MGTTTLAPQPLTNAQPAVPNPPLTTTAALFLGQNPLLMLAAAAGVFAVGYYIATRRRK